MATAAPRPSVVAMFDPLRATPSPPSSPESDKENKGALFVSRKATEPVALPESRRRLVDIGDETLPEEDDYEERDNTFPTSSSARDKPPSSRVPLAELRLLHEETTPVRKRQTFTHPPFAPSSLSKSFTTYSPTKQLDRDEDDVPSSPTVPIVAHGSSRKDDLMTLVFSSQTNLGSNSSMAHASTLSLEHGHGLVGQSDPASPPFIMSPRARQFGTRLNVEHDSNMSNSSFHMRLDSLESTFDLLNDRISFLVNDNSQASFAGLDSEQALPKLFNESSKDSNSSSPHEPLLPSPFPSQTPSQSHVDPHMAVPSLRIVKHAKPPLLATDRSNVPSARSDLKSSAQRLHARKAQALSVFKAGQQFSSEPQMSMMEDEAPRASQAYKRKTAQNNVQMSLSVKNPTGIKRSYDEFNPKEAVHWQSDGPRRVLAKKAHLMPSNTETRSLTYAGSQNVASGPPKAANGLRVPAETRPAAALHSSRLPAPSRAASVRSGRGSARGSSSRDRTS